MSALLRSFLYAFRGLWFAIENERNMRIHLCCLGYMMFFLLRYDFFEVNRTQGAVLALAAALVIVSEYINTAIERAVDTAAKGEISESAKIAKDTAAGAVLAATVFAIITGVIILFQPAAFEQMFNYFSENPVKFVILLLSLAVSVCFMFIPPSKYLKVFRRKYNE